MRIQKTLVAIIIIFVYAIPSQGFAQAERFRLNAMIVREIMSPGNEKTLKHNLWLDRVNTLEIQPKNIVFSVDDKVIVFQIVSKSQITSAKIKYIVEVNGTKKEFWRIINQPKERGITFEFYGKENSYIRYLASKI